MNHIVRIDMQSPPRKIVAFSNEMELNEWMNEWMNDAFI